MKLKRTYKIPKKNRGCQVFHAFDKVKFLNKPGNLIKAVIFDIDGTLLDSNDAHAESFVAAFKKFGKTVSFVELKWLIGMGTDKILEKYLTKKEIKGFGKDLTEYHWLAPRGGEAARCRHLRWLKTGVVFQRSSVYWTFRLY